MHYKLHTLVILMAFSGAELSSQVGLPLELIELSNGAGGLQGLLGPGGNFGAAVAAAGDLDGDGIQDLLVGAPRDGLSGLNAGAVWVLFLKADGSVRASRRIDSASGDLCAALAASDDFGSAIEPLGDLDLDGVPEFAIGVPSDDLGGTDRGTVFILSLLADGSANACTKIGSGLGGFGGALEDSDQFGSALARLGDLDGNGVTELAVGAPLSNGVGSDDGALWILFLQNDGTVLTEQKLGHAVGGFTGTLDSLDTFGQALAGPGDLNADGVPDLLVGAAGDDDAVLNAGAVWVLYLGVDGQVLSQAKITTGMHGFSGVLKGSDGFGGGLHALPDIDGNGIRDVLVGIPSRDQIFVADAGGYWLLLLGSGGTVQGEQQVLPLEMPGPYTNALEDALGSAMAYLGDTDGDGAPSVAFGTRGRSSVTTGRTFVVELCDADPLPAFSALGVTIGTSPLSVDFQDETVGSGLSAWSWSFGDGGVSTEQNPSHTFTKVGTYAVSLTATGSDGTCTLVQEGFVVVDSAFAKATERNGSGSNPDYLESLTLPVLGLDWMAVVDATAIGATGLVFVVGYEFGLQGVNTAFGELLIDPVSSLLVIDIGVFVVGQSTHAIPVPNDAAIAGCSVSVQALVNNPGLLTNAVDLVLGL